MELRDIVGRYAEALQAVDATTTIINTNRRTGDDYPPGLKSLREDQAVAQMDAQWAAKHPGDFVDPTLPRVGRAYGDLPGTLCDHVFTTVGNPVDPEWAVEFKYVALAGDNGKLNGYTVVKTLSPFLTDRSLLHDVLRLRTYHLARRHAVVGYGFNYNGDSCDEAVQRHPNEMARIRNLRRTCLTNGGSLTLRPLLDFAEGILSMRGLIRGPRVEEPFEAWRHACGGRGVVFGWEVRRPELEPDYDPRHPW